MANFWGVEIDDPKKWLKKEISKNDIQMGPPKKCALLPYKISPGCNHIIVQSRIRFNFPPYWERGCDCAPIFGPFLSHFAGILSYRAQFHFPTTENHGLYRVFRVSRFFGGILLSSFLGTNFLDTTNPPTRENGQFMGSKKLTTLKNGNQKETSKNGFQMGPPKKCAFLRC